MLDKEQVIKGLEQFKSDFKPFCGNNADWKRVDDAISLLKEQEAKKVIESTNIVRCDDCEYSFCEGFVRERLYCEKHPELGEIKCDWFCADCWKA